MGTKHWLASALACIPLIAAAQPGETVYATYCAACHESPTDEKVPPVAVLRSLDANTILDALSSGKMRLQAQALTTEQRVDVAEYLAGAPVATRVARFEKGRCDARPSLPELAAGGIWNGWGPDTSNARYQAAAGIVAAQVPKLELKWAFGIPNTQQSRSQATVVGGRLFMGSQSGAVYALDAETGCLYWTFEANTWVRTAPSVGPYSGGYAVYFTDAEATAYAVDAQTGQALWSRKIDEHAAARGTGSPTLYKGRLYVPLSGVSEESASSSPDYECCTFRGSVTALDAETGEVVWKSYTLPEPERRGTSSAGKPLWGPSGVPIWSAPTIDAKRGLIYVGTGNAYADPDYGRSDAIIAMSIETGKIAWVNQVMDPDTWIMGCGGDAPIGRGGRGGGFGRGGGGFAPRGGGAPPGGGGSPGGGGGAAPAGNGAAPPRGGAAPARGGFPGRGFGPPGGGAAAGPNPNCPESVGPDFDFSASPLLTTLADGRDVLIATQKAGMGYALDPDNQGQTLWMYRWGAGSPVGGVWGATSDGERAYFDVADQLSANAGGVHAVDIATGERVWFAEPETPLCGSGAGCSAAQSAALTSIPGAVFAGSADGGVRAYDASTGKIIWRFDTNREFDTVNGVMARGGSIDGPGPVVSGGMLFVTAGNGGIVGMPGNVLLAFAVRE